MTITAVAAALTLTAAADGMQPGEMRYIPLPAPAGSIVEDRSWKSNRTVWTAENGAAFDGKRMWFHGGGHADGAHNGVWQLDLETLTWSRPFLNQPLTREPLLPDVGSGCRRPAEGPEATHTYNFIDYLKSRGKVLLWTTYASYSGVSPSPPCNFTGPGVKGWWEYDPATAKWTALATPETEAAGTSKLAGWVPQKVVAWAERPDGVVELFGDTKWCRLYGMAIRDCWQQNKTPWWARYVPEVGFVVVTRRAVEVYEDRALVRYWPLPLELAREADLAGIEPFGKELSWWPGGATVRYLNLETGEWREEVAVGSALPDLTDSRTQRATHTDQSPLSKWRWLSEHLVFVGVPTPDGVWLYRPQRVTVPSPVARLPCGEQTGVLIEQNDTVIAGCTEGTTKLVGKEPTKFGVVRTKPGVLNTTLRDLTLTLGSEAMLGDNIAAVRAQGTGLTLERVRTEYPIGDGLLSGENCGEWVISNSNIDKAGGGRNEGHGIYHCSADKFHSAGSLTITNSTVLDCRYRTKQYGEAIKTRAGRLRLDRVVAGGVDAESNCDKALSMTQGGDGLVTNAVFLQPPRADSDVIIGYGQELRCGNQGWKRVCKPLDKRAGLSDICVADADPVPEGYYCKEEYPGSLVIRDSLVVCDKHRYVAGVDKGPAPCRVLNETRGILQFENVTFVNVRTVDGTNPVGGQTVCVNCKYFPTREAASLPSWPAVPDAR